MRFAIPTLLAILVAVAARPARPCSFAGPEPLQIDDAESALDSTPPDAPVVRVVGVNRGVGPERSGCGEMSATSCDDLGWITLQIDPTADDRTPPDDIGYIVEIEGEAPDGIYGYDEPVVPLDGELMLIWIDGATDQQEAFDFRVVVTAVDRGGNMSEPSEVLRVVDAPTSAACAVQRGRSVPVPELLVVVGLLAVGVRRTTCVGSGTR